MSIKKLIIGVLGLFLIAGAGFIALNIFFMSQTTDNITETSDTANTMACKQSLSSLSRGMEPGDTKEIPDSCFSENQVLSAQLEGASPGDEFRKTRSGVELASQAE